MTDRTAQIRTFLEASGWAAAAVSPLAGDASARRYLRLVRGDGDGAVLMDAPPDLCGDADAFVAVARHLLGLGLSAPRILAEDAAAGLLLLEDLGDGVFTRLVEGSSGTETALYAAAAEALATVQSAPAPDGLTAFTPARMAELAGIVFDWYAPETSARDRATVLARLEEILDSVAPRPSVLALRDVHAENLLWLPGRAGVARVGLLDFQDAVLAHPAYDLVSLLDDARRDVGEDARTAAVSRFLDLTGHDAQSFGAASAALTLQRNLRILGVFARLARRDGRTAYLRHLPRVRAHVVRALGHPALLPLGDTLLRLLPPPAATRPSSPEAPCATPVP